MNCYNNSKRVAMIRSLNNSQVKFGVVVCWIYNSCITSPLTLYDTYIESQLLA